MENKSFLATLKKNAMLIVMVLVYLFFLVMTKGGIFNPSSFTELINQNRDKLELLAKTLLEQETMDGRDVEKLLGLERKHDDVDVREV